MIHNILSIAGSDPSGGAGIQADLKTFAALGAYGLAIPTTLTVQNTRGVQQIFPLPHDLLRDQMVALLEDVEIHAIKIGMVGNKKNARVIGEILHVLHEELGKEKYPPVIIDPVYIEGAGNKIINDQAFEALAEHVFLYGDLITPNIPEAARILNQSFAGDYGGDMKAMAKALWARFHIPVLLKGGHGEGDICTDVLDTGQSVKTFSVPRVVTKNTHGTGCTLSSAIAVYRAQGCDLEGAVEKAKAYLTGALIHADDLNVGEGTGPLHHFYDVWKRS